MHINMSITKNGKQLIKQASKLDKTLVITKIVVGEGFAPAKKDIVDLKQLVQPVVQLPLEDYAVNVSGVGVVLTRICSDIARKNVWLKEIGIYAKVGDNEMLCWYGSMGENDVYIPNNDDTSFDLRQILIMMPY